MASSLTEQRPVVYGVLLYVPDRLCVQFIDFAFFPSFSANFLTLSSALPLAERALFQYHLCIFVIKPTWTVSSAVEGFECRVGYK